MGELSLFIPITKVDATQRLVYGLATAEIEDRSGEICDYATTKPNYERWSDEIARSTSGKSLGNLRAMHGRVAAGKVTAITFNDDAKQIEICAKVVDDSEWVKVEEGVYTGFSQGGSYERRWTDDAGRTRYTAVPSEISLVDLPCLPQARFEMIKTDGTHELHEFGAREGVATRLESLVVELDWLENLSSEMAVDVPGLADVIDDLRDLSLGLTTVLRSVASGDAKHRNRAGSDPNMPAESSNSTREAAGVPMPRDSGTARRGRDGKRERIRNPYEKVVGRDDDRSSLEATWQGLDKHFDALAATLADVLQRIKNIEEQPLPLPLSGARRIVAKHEDGILDLHAASTIDSVLADPEALSILAIRLAQRNGRGPAR